MSRTARAKRIAISVFLLGHLSALAVWNAPRCAIRDRLIWYAYRYLAPTGLWQGWAMFAPDPARNTLTLEALTLDKQGLIREYKFPRTEDFSWWERIPRFRHSKLAANFGSEEFEQNRACAARYVARTLEIPPDAFPVDVEFLYQVLETPPPGNPPADPMTTRKAQSIRSYRVETWEEARS